MFGLTVQSIDVDGVVNDYLFLTFRKNLSANASLTVEVSSDLITWSQDPATIKPVSKADNGDGTATVTFRFDRSNWPRAKPGTLSGCAATDS